MVVQLVDLPLEVLERISECLCPHCFEGSEDAYERFRGLFNLILTCKVLGSVAQPALYHCPFHTETWLRNLRPEAPPDECNDLGPNIAQLVRTVIEAPALAAAVRELNFCPTFPQYKHALSKKEIAFFEREMNFVLNGGEEDWEDQEDEGESYSGDDENDDDEESDDEEEEEENDDENDDNDEKEECKAGNAEEKDEEDEEEEEEDDDDDDGNEEDENENDKRTTIKCHWKKVGAVFTPDAKYSCDSNEYLRMLLVAKTPNLELLGQFEPSSFDRPDFELPRLRNLFLWHWKGQLGWGMEYIDKILEGAPALQTINCTGIYGAKLGEGHIYHETVTDLFLQNAMLSPEHLCNIMRGFPNLKGIMYIPGDNVPSGYEAPLPKDIADALWIRSDSLERIEVNLSNYDNFKNHKVKPIDELEGMAALKSLVWIMPLVKFVWVDGEWEHYTRFSMEEEDDDDKEEEEEDDDDDE